MKIKYNSEVISGAIFLVVAVVLWLLIPSQIDTMETSKINAQTVPAIAVGGLALSSLGLLLQGIFTIPKKEFMITRDTLISNKFRNEMKSLFYAGMLLVYAVVLTWAGFLVATGLLTVAILVFYGTRKWYYYAIPLVTVGVVYFVFKTVLHVSLP